HFTKTGPITRSQAMGLFNEKVKLDSKDADDYAFLVLPAPPQAISNPAAPPALPVVGQRVRVETVAEYLAALKRGAAPFTTFDQAVDEVFRSTASTLKFLAEAVESRRSSLPAKLLEDLPVSVLGYHDSDQERELATAAAKGATLRDYSRSGKLQKFRSTATTCSLSQPTEPTTSPNWLAATSTATALKIRWLLFTGITGRGRGLANQCSSCNGLRVNR
ncbi:MAG: hypothetical protein EBS84_22985, partial [Proteobacteria bacterium]|nr:hypothetical protein [Pseudomonadota bacterium]